MLFGRLVIFQLAKNRIHLDDSPDSFSPWEILKHDFRDDSFHETESIDAKGKKIRIILKNCMKLIGCCCASSRIHDGQFFLILLMKHPFPFTINSYPTQFVSTLSARDFYPVTTAD